MRKSACHEFRGDPAGETPKGDFTHASILIAKGMAAGSGSRSRSMLRPATPGYSMERVVPDPRMAERANHTEDNRIVVSWRFRQACRRAPAPGDSPQQFARSKLRPRPATSPKIWGGCGSLLCQCDHGSRDRQVARAGDLVHCQERERRRAAGERPECLRLFACGARCPPASATRCQPSNRRTAPCQWPGLEHKNPSSRSRLLLTSALRISDLVAKLSTRSSRISDRFWSVHSSRITSE